MKTPLLAAVCSFLVATGSAIAQKVDWNATKITSSSSVLNPGWRINVKMTVANRGSGLAPAVLATIAVAGSADGKTCATPLGTLSFPALGAGKSHEASAIFELPVRLPDGQAWLIGTVNPAKRHVETSHANNTASTTATAKGLADLVAKALTMTETVFAAGDTTRLYADIENDSCVRSASNAAGFFLSTDATIDKSDTSLLVTPPRSYDPDDVANYTWTVTIPSTTTAGIYWIGVLADHDDVVKESDETNNAKAVQIRVYQKGSWSIYGQSCKGSHGLILKHTAKSFSTRLDPHIGMTARYLLDQALANSVALLAFGTSKTTWGSAQLPLNLDAFGAPGCQVLARPDLFFPTAVNSSSQGRVEFVIPNDQNLIGKRYYTQYWNLDPRANSLGLTFSPGVDTTLGSR